MNIHLGKVYTAPTVWLVWPLPNRSWWAGSQGLGTESPAPSQAGSPPSGQGLSHSLPSSSRVPLHGRILCNHPVTTLLVFFWLGRGGPRVLCNYSAAALPGHFHFQVVAGWSQGTLQPPCKDPVCSFQAVAG